MAANQVVAIPPPLFDDLDWKLNGEVRQHTVRKISSRRILAI
jgi:hypothetical protein